MSDSIDDQRVDNKRRHLLALMGGGGVASMAGCLGIFDDGDDNNEELPADEIPMDGEFTASVGANPNQFDPTVTNDAPSASIAALQYEQLVEPDFNNSITAALAEDWEQEDETTYRFDLREGIEFHSGGEMTADDVEHSVLRMQGTVNDAVVSTWYEDSEVVDDYTIRFSLSQPHAPFLSDISGVPIISADATKQDIAGEDVEKDNTFEENSVGTGPFVIENVEPQDRIELSRYDDYWFEQTEEMPGMAPWETVTFRVVVEQTAQQEALRSGELDMIDNANPVELGTLDGEQNTSVETTTGLGYDFVSFPVNTEPYTNPKFRRGITRLIPVSDVIEAVWSGYAVEQAGPISPGLGEMYDEEFEQMLLDEYVGEDPEAARQLLDEAFEEEDIEKPFEVSLITNENRTRERWMEVIQQTLDDTEYFDASLDIRPFDALVPFLIGGEAAESQDIVGIGWTGGSDPDGHVAQVFESTNQVPDGFNWTRYENDEVDRLIEEGRQTSDPDARKQVYQNLSELLAQEVPAAFMWTSDQYDVVRTDGVANWRPYPNASLRYVGVYRPYLGQVSYRP
ncbi:ABC transporter substrate-binding protein [Salinibaculum salinum]|uniref:ABC transporter substrate-binding protein n=1 Tax=Salinibaculum salinum TaxID=3131996 RepID=UPI0030EBA7E9